MGVEALEIFLDDPLGGVFFAGQIVRGTVHVELSADKEMRGN